MALKNNKYYLELWSEYREGIERSSPIDIRETKADQIKRIKKLEANPEEWFKYYFARFYTSEPAPFHPKATKRILSNPEWFEVRAWSRELSKSGRTMFEILFLTLTGKKRNVLMISATQTDAERLLLPYKSNLEVNQRIIHDYGVQESLGNWTANEFSTKKGVAFRAIGAGQSPRGTRKDEVRPDTIIIDDIDTDQEVRNPKLIDKKVDWCERALFGTRSISNPMLIIVCGNIIGKKTTVTELSKKADYFEVINIRDKNGKSTWPSRNTEAMIDRTLSKISFAAAQGEYFNNPMTIGKVFKDINFGKCPPISKCEQVIAYADPATSNKDNSGSTKSVVIVGYLNFVFYVYKVRLGQMGTAKFIEALYDADDYLRKHKVDIKRIWIENNSLQDPFWEQVIYPAIKQHAKIAGRYISVSPDPRKKPDKFYRIEGTLEPVHRRGELIFNVEEESSPDMQLFKEQWLGVDESSKVMDGPDALEGAVHKIQNRTVQKDTTYVVAPINSRKY